MSFRYKKNAATCQKLLAFVDVMVLLVEEGTKNLYLFGQAGENDDKNKPAQIT